jgi:hypothetical protein
MKSCPGWRQPKNRSEEPIAWPWAFLAARSCKNPRKGARPVPGPIMTIGVAGSSGRRNADFVSFTNASMTLPSGCWRR